MKTKVLLKLLFGILLLGLCGLGGAASTAAQTGSTLRISAPDFDNYPLVTVYIDPTNRAGTPLQNLSPDQITLSEDGIQRDLVKFEQLQPGIQLVVAFNLSDAFGIQDINGRARFDFIKEALLNWSARPPENSLDDLSLVANTELEATHLDRREDWRPALEGFSPELQGVESSFNVLARAIAIASDPVSQPGMKRVVLFFTAQPASEDYPALASLLSQALDQQVLIYSILVSSPAFFETEGAARLQDLSQQTGGVFLTFSGEEPLADLGQLLQPLRSTYQIQYQSSIVSGGTHQLQVSIASTPADILGQREFNLEIQPPNPILISPPRKITRTAPVGGRNSQEQIHLQPEAVTLPILIEFPDGYPRDLEELIFRVDGEIVDQITDPPYDQVIWDLENYQTGGTYYLTLEAVDIMGLSKLSLATPVEIEIDLPPQTIGNIISRNAPEFAGLAFILLLGMTLFILINSGTIRPNEGEKMSWIIDQGKRTAGAIRKFLFQDNQEGDNPPGSDIQPYRLIPINDLSRQLFTEPIIIYQEKIILGNKPDEDLIQIQHPSVFPKHTRITARENHQYQLTDCGSTAGTWINYQQLSSAKSHFLKDGDIIHIGEAAFRFQLISELRSSKENNS